MNIIFILSVYVLMPIFQFRFKSLDNEIEIASDFVSEYSVMFSNLPKLTTPEELKDFVNETFFGGSPNVEKINFIYDTFETHTLTDTLESSMTVLFKLLNRKKETGSTKDDVRIQQLKDQIGELRVKLSDLDEIFENDKQAKFLGKAIVILRFKSDSDYILSETEQSWFTYLCLASCRRKCIFKGKPTVTPGNELEVKRAQEAVDIVWENQSTTKLNSAVRKVAVILSTIVIPTLSMIIVYLLDLLYVQTI
jgi:hypothetical protein